MFLLCFFLHFCACSRSAFCGQKRMYIDIEQKYRIQSYITVATLAAVPLLPHPHCHAAAAPTLATTALLPLPLPLRRATAAAAAAHGWL
jgi:hypothetical protein